MTSDEVRDSVPCPQCGAPAGVKCREGGRARANHPKRTGKAEMMVGWRNPALSPSLLKQKQEWRQSRYRRRG
jgi:hypothetical protein